MSCVAGVADDPRGIRRGPVLSESGECLVSTVEPLGRGTGNVLTNYGGFHWVALAGSRPNIAIATGLSRPRAVIFHNVLSPATNRQHKRARGCETVGHHPRIEVVRSAPHLLLCGFGVGFRECLEFRSADESEPRRYGALIIPPQAIAARSKTPGIWKRD